MTSLDGKCTVTMLSGKIINPFSVRVEDICLQDIAYGLSHIGRYMGQTRVFVSVAEHSVILSHVVPKPHKRHALFHDGDEVIFGDMPAPIKNTPEELYRREAEERASAAIFQAFGLHPDLPPIVKVLDKQVRLFENEARGKRVPDRHEWPEELQQAVPVTRATPFFVRGLGPKKARALFLERYLEIFDPRW